MDKLKKFNDELEITSDVPPAPDLSALRLYYEEELMVPRAIHVLRPDGTEVLAQRIVIEVTPMTIPKVVAFDE